MLRKKSRSSSNSGGMKATPSTAVNDMDTLRNKQLETLKQHFSSNLQVVTPNSVYDIPFQTLQGQSFTLRVTLSDQFPHQPPAVQLMQPAKHRFLDIQGFVIPQAHGNLAQWTAHTALGRTIYELVQTFIQDPPQVISLNRQPSVQQQQPSLAGSMQPMMHHHPSLSPPGSYNSNPNINNPNVMIMPNTQSPIHHPSMMMTQPIPQTSMMNPMMMPITSTSTSSPPMTNNPNNSNNNNNSTYYPEVEALTPQQLHSILNNEQEFQSFFESLEAVRAMKASRGAARDGNERLANQNLGNEKQLNDLKRENSALQRAVNEKRAAFDQKAQRQQQVMTGFTTSSLIDKLKVASSEAEKESDQLSEQFLNGQLNASDFVKQFTAKRKLHHLRAAKCEYLQVHNPQMRK